MKINIELIRENIKQHDQCAEKRHYLNGLLECISYQITEKLQCYKKFAMLLINDSPFYKHIPDFFPEKGIIVHFSDGHNNDGQYFTMTIDLFPYYDQIVKYLDEFIDNVIDEAIKKCVFIES
jgi:hypothetical protein